MSLELLRQFAQNNSVSRAVHTLSLEDARDAVKIKDAAKKKAADGSESLALYLGRFALSLDVVLKGATKIVAQKEDVSRFRNMLRQHINNGVFDDAIVKAQHKSRESTEKQAQDFRAAQSRGEVHG